MSKTQLAATDRIISPNAQDWPACFREIQREVAEHVQWLADEAAADTPVQGYLQDCVERFAAIYAATSSAVWLLDAQGDQLRLAAQLRFARLELRGEPGERHLGLLQHALKRDEPLVVLPNSAVPTSDASRDGQRVANPTDSFLVLGAIRHAGQPLGVLELSLGPRPPRGQTVAMRKGYAKFLEHLLGLLEAGLQRRAARNLLVDGDRAAHADAQSSPEAITTEQPKPAAPRLAPIQWLDQLQHEVAVWRVELRARLERQLAQLSGMRGNSLRENQALAKEIQRLLDGNSLRIQCPECGHPAILRCQSGSGSRHGLFVYDHYLPSGRTFHGGHAALPEMKLVDKPPRKPRKDQDPAAD